MKSFNTPKKIEASIFMGLFYIIDFFLYFSVAIFTGLLNRNFLPLVIFLFVLALLLKEAWYQFFSILKSV